METLQALAKRRTVRRFEQRLPDRGELLLLVEMARLAASAANLQHLRYHIVTAPETVRRLFSHTRWAGYVQPRRNPVWGESAPLCFIAVTAPAAEAAAREVDAGAAIQNLLLAACDRGLGGCWIGAFDRPEAAAILELPPETHLSYLVAVGYPAEDPAMEEIDAGDSIQYRLDESDRLHVPKIRADQLIRWHE